MKKRLWIYPILCLVWGGFLLGYFRYFAPKAPVDFSDLWFSNRPLPERIALNSYLAGNFARTNHDLERAVDAYIQVLKMDPKNTTLLNDTYVLAMVQGSAEKILPFLNDVTQDKMMTDYTRVAALFRENNLDAALNQLKQKQPHLLDPVLVPMVKAWIYAKKNDHDSAVKAINQLSDHPFILGYESVLLGDYFHDEDLIQKGIVKMGDSDLPAIGYFPLLKKIISQSGNWEKSALFKTYQELAVSYPVTADLLVQIGQTELSPEKGLAEAFYLASATGGDGKLTREEALATNTLALFLQPDKQLSLVWGAELSEGLELPKVALSYYNRLTFNSASLTFKKAASMMLTDNTAEALLLLKELEKTNQTNIPLLTLLGQAYQDQNQNQKAIDTYDRLIPLLEKELKNKPLIHAYMNRGILYGSEQSDKMLSDLEKAKALDPENEMLLNDLGYHLLESGLTDEGFALVQKAYQKKPNDPYILDSMAFAYWKKGQALIALPLAEKALNLMPQSALINAHLGDIYDSLGRHREASFQYKKALDLETDLTENLTQELNQKLKEKK